MADLLGALKDTPLPTILVVAGIVFLMLAVAGSIAGQIRIQRGKQRAAGLIGGVLLLLGLLLYVIPSAKPPAPRQPFADTIKIKSVRPATDTALHQASDIQVDLTYSLFSADEVTLAIYLEQFEPSAARCDGAVHQTNGATNLRLARGEHAVSTTIHWPGAPGTGFVTIGANYWKDVDGQPQQQHTDLGLFRNLCYAFGP